MKIYGLKNCDSCRKARKALPRAMFIDIRENPLSLETLEQMLNEFGDALVNKKSTTWRNLLAFEKNQSNLELIQSHPTVMKRPIIVSPGAFHLGWTAQVQSILVSQEQ